jgi:hypothetical protein
MDLVCPDPLAMYGEKYILKKERQDYYALRYSCYSDFIMAPGIDHILHYEWLHSHSLGDCYCGYFA